MVASAVGALSGSMPERSTKEKKGEVRHDVEKRQVVRRWGRNARPDAAHGVPGHVAEGEMKLPTIGSRWHGANQKTAAFSMTATVTRYEETSHPGNPLVYYRYDGHETEGRCLLEAWDQHMRAEVVRARPLLGWDALTSRFEHVRVDQEGRVVYAPELAALIEEADGLAELVKGAAEILLEEHAAFRETHASWNERVSRYHATKARFEKVFSPPPDDGECAGASGIDFTMTKPLTVSEPICKHCGLTKTRHYERRPRHIFES
jgi:hypothetical protein